MADKPIGDLTPATAVGVTDLFVLEQNSIAKSLTGNTLKNWLLELAEGHGGIASIAYTAPVYPSLVGTMTITYADDTTATLNINNGRGISSISSPTTSGLVKTYTINYNDGTTSTFAVTDGETGAAGSNAYVHIKYSSVQPTQDGDMHDTADKWMGVYSGSSSTAPTHYTSYVWYEIKGVAGTAATVAVGTVTATTVQAGGNAWATITNSGTSAASVLNFSLGIPRGQDGSGAGSVTSVTVAGASGITASGNTTITSSGTVTLGHSNTCTPQNVQGWYKFAVDGQGHITSTGTQASPSEIGAIANPASKSNGQVLTYNGTDWVAQNPSGSVTSVNGMTGAVVTDTARTALLYTSSWTQSGNYYTKTVSVTGVTATNTIQVSPDPEYYEDWAECAMRASAQGTNTITFKCKTIPTRTLTANILITEAAQ